MNQNLYYLISCFIFQVADPFKKKLFKEVNSMKPAEAGQVTFYLSVYPVCHCVWEEKGV